MEENRFLKGIKDGIPICLGYFSVSFAFGIYALASGLSVLQAVLMSAFNVTSAGQFAAVPIICGGGGLMELISGQIIINMRYALMSVSLSQKLGKSIKLPHRFLIAFLNTDEIFAVAVSQDKQVGKKYMFGLILTPFLGWTLGTLSGATLGNILPEIVVSALSIAIYAMFIAIVVPEMKKNSSVMLCVLSAILLSCLFYYIPTLNKIPSGFTVIICSVVASVLFAIIKPINEEDKANEV